MILTGNGQRTDPLLTADRRQGNADNIRRDFLRHFCARNDCRTIKREDIAEAPVCQDTERFTDGSPGFQGVLCP